MESTTGHQNQPPKSPGQNCRIARVAGLIACLGLIPASHGAEAAEFRLNLEPAVGLWLDEPQSSHFTPGFYGAVRPGVALGEVVTLQWSYALLVTPADEGFDELGTGNFFTTGVRLRPFGASRDEDDQLAGLSVDANVGYVRTGELNRVGYDMGIGYNFDAGPRLALGPILRYGQIVQPDDLFRRDPNDAQFLTAGLNFAFGPKHVAEEPHVCPDAPECVQEAPPKVEEAPVVVLAPKAPACPDRDQDTMCDPDDRCPTQVGPPETLGCPTDPCTGSPLLIQVHFGFDSAVLPLAQDGPTSMDPVLDAVAAAIAKNPSCRVCISGHTSSEGSAAYNLDLSRQRASAVQNYMVARGLSESRIPSNGMGESCQLVPAEGLELNRRVEFRGLGEGESCPQACEK